MTIKRAITFGQKYRNDYHPKLGSLAHPDGYIVVEASSLDDVDAFLQTICGRQVFVLSDGGTQLGAVLYAFDYDLETFEAPGGTAERHHPRGRLASFTTMPADSLSEASRKELADLIERARECAEGDSNDEEIEALQDVMNFAEGALQS